MWCGTLAGAGTVAAFICIAIVVAIILMISHFKSVSEKIGKPVWAAFILAALIPNFILMCGVTTELFDRYEIDGCR